MIYPILITVPEAGQLLRLGRTSIYKLINENNLKVIKLNRATRITFSSIIHYLALSMKNGQDRLNTKGNCDCSVPIDICVIADHLASQLCNIPQSNTKCSDSSPIIDNIPSYWTENTNIICSAGNNIGEKF